MPGTKPTALLICGPYKGNAVRPIEYLVKAEYDNGRFTTAPIHITGRRSHAIKLTKSIRGRKKWGKIPMFMHWSFDNSRERISEATGLTDRQI